MGDTSVAGQSDIDRSWRRSSLYGVDPAAPIDDLPQVDVDRESRLLRAATPVLDQLAIELEGENFGLLLTDERTRIIGRRVGSTRVEQALDGISAIPGISYSEEAVGTNALGTPNETGEPISVIGEEHFNESLRDFCCFGAPIRSPITGRIRGVLDICGHVSDKDGLFPPYVMGAVRQIEQRLAEDAVAGSRHLLAEYHGALARSRLPVIALNDEVALTCRTAQALLTPTDLGFLEEARLRMTESSAEWGMVLTSGAAVTVEGRVVSGGGTIFRLIPEEGPHPSGQADQLPRPGGHVTVVTGEAGSGRTARARDLMGSSEAIEIDGVALADADPRQLWLRVRPTLTSVAAALLIEDVQDLPGVLVRQLADWMRRNPRRRIVMTMLSGAELNAQQAALVSMASEEIVVPTLREHRQDIPRIAESLLAEEGFAGVRVAPTAMRMLLAQQWHGNLVELRNVLRTAASSRAGVDIQPADLPTRYRAVKTGLSRMEQIERDAIVDALTRNAGHRGRAAEHLGVSRRTIFNRIRALHISEDEICTA